MQRRLAMAAGVAGALALAPAARAGVPDTYGIGSTSVGRAGAAAATARGFEALHYNPAGLAEATRATFAAALHVHYSLLRAGETRAPLREPIGYAVGAVAPVPLGGFLEGRVTVALLVFMLPTSILDAQLHAPDEPFFLRYDDAAGRAVAEPGLAIEILDGLSVGAALDAFAGLDGFAGAREGATRGIDATIAVVTPVAASLHLGARWRPSFFRALSLALAYRSPFRIGIRLDAATEVGGLPIDLRTVADAFFQPATYVAAAAFDAGPLTASLDVAWRRWSKMGTPFVTVDAELVDTIALAADPPRANLRDVPELRVGLELRLPVARAARLALQGGYAIEPTPVPLQTGATNLLDSTHHVLAAGATLALPPLGGRLISIGLHAGASLLPARTHEKDLAIPCAGGGICDSDTTSATFETDNPGYPSIRGGGAVLFGGLTIEIGL